MTRQNIVTAKISDDLQDWIDQQTKASGMTTSALINEALRDLKAKREEKA